MIARHGLITGALGTYSELIVAAAFLAEGYDIAFPLGNQRAWDLIAREPATGEWKRVQVKTVSARTNREFPSIQLRRGARKREESSSGKLCGIGYSAKDVDFLVAVYPETGTLWRVPPEGFAGKGRVRLGEGYLWRGVMEYSATPLVTQVKPFRILHQETLAEQRASVRAQLPQEKPADISEKSWESLLRWCAGYGYGAIAKEVGVSLAAVSERVRRALSRLGLNRLPDSYNRKGGRPKGNALHRTVPQ